MAAPMHQLVNSIIPAYACPAGTKMHILNLGTLTVDEGWYVFRCPQALERKGLTIRLGTLLINVHAPLRLLMGVNGGSASNPNPTNKRRDLMLIAGLIEHPEMGLILFECGSSEDAHTQWGAEAVDLFPRTTYDESHHLPKAIESAGYSIKDVKAVIMGHLHLDHAGGLEHFKNTQIPIYVHEEEFKNACWAAGTKSDAGLYLADYLHLDGGINWQTFNDSHLDLCTGITLYHCPGHTPGLCIMQVNLLRDGTFIWTTDQYHVRENFDSNWAHGWLLRDYRSWIDSGKLIRRLQKAFSATLIFGHDYATADALIKSGPYLE
ncbi:metallo-beta-lactamase superfamily protein [Penicillium macrosclerotiorum]|uniref:metallo-beta-lactamase superfamily protein n=1 Tax=Penicillium macrosclerotiorum TaxID=303699 RepID=UPI00254979C3|nr:metallo-beta-lactamase superfamily protein [Penicillium macrosclerotiorum]KAJ5683443.1 metallo-beta-lactamase superfamily protein [Penicillium macrosclerotiorum]